jgi:hypothetical protein
VPMLSKALEEKSFDYQGTQKDDLCSSHQEKWFMLAASGTPLCYHRQFCRPRPPLMCPRLYRVEGGVLDARRSAVEFNVSGDPLLSGVAAVLDARRCFKDRPPPGLFLGTAVTALTGLAAATADLSEGAADLIAAAVEVVEATVEVLLEDEFLQTNLLSE